MPRTRPAPAKPLKSGSAELGLAGRFLQAVADAPSDEPLPTTRELGKRFGVASATAYRVLQKLSGEGKVWQHPVSGRYYHATARALLDRPKPVACLFRRLELNSEQYREILEGISQGCGALHRTMLLWHDELLINHVEPENPPHFATPAQQGAILSDFLLRHGDAAGGFVLDHMWSDDVMRLQVARLQPAVVLFRACALSAFHNIRADFRSGALKALAHLLGRGFEQIVPVEPFPGDPAVSEFFAALVRAVDETGCRARLGKLVTAHTPAERRALIADLRRGTRRTALVCPEDNVSTLLVSALAAAEIPCPNRIGVLSVMGTDTATGAGISCLRYDFRALGRMAIDALRSPTPVLQMLEPQLVSGRTT